MRKEQFRTLEVGDRVHYEHRGVIIDSPIKSVERFGIVPGVFHTFSFTLQTDHRMKIDDADIAYLSLKSRANPTMYWWPCIWDADSSRITRVVGPLSSQTVAREFLEHNYRALFLKVEAIPQPESLVDNLIFEQVPE